MRAFQAAKGASTRKGRESKHGADFAEWREFRLLLVYIRQYFEVWQMFDEVDSADDKRVNLDEFKAALAKIESWGLKVDDAEAEFKAIDKNGGGQVLFIEFADWALNKKLDLEDDDDEDADAPIPTTTEQKPESAEEKKEEAAAAEEKPKESVRSKIDWEKISSKLP